MGKSGARVVLCLSASCFPLSQPWAQSTDDAVTVTATRVERPSLDVPASIDRVTAEEIRFARPQVNLSESLGRVPGIVVSNRQNYAQDLQVQSRGFGARSTFGIRGLRLMADGIPASMPDGQGQASTFDLGSAERIEVLRGPFSVMYGNSSGGVINVLTESGADNPGVQGELWGGSYGTWKSALKAGGGTRERDWLADLSHFETDGYREHSAAKRDQLNAKLGFGLGAGTRLGLVINSLDSPEVQDPLGLTRAQMLADPRSVDPGAIAFDTRKSVRQNQAGATLSHQLGGGTLAASAYAGHRTVRQYLSIPLATQNANTHSGGVVDLDRDYAGASLRYSVELAVPVTLVFGGEYERQAERRRGYINNFGAIGALKRDEDDTVDSTGVFAQVEWRFARDWLLLAGVRSSRVEFESTDYFVRPAAPPANNGDDSGSVSYSATTPALGLLYKLAPAASLYANYGEGFETPTFAELAYQNNNQPGLNFGLQASKSRHAEAGVKWVVGSRGRVNFAVFDIETENEIVVDQNSGGRSTFKNAGRTRRTGAELFGEATLGAGFDALVAWTTVDARYLDSFTTRVDTPAVAATVPAGNKLPGVPNDYVYAELRWRYVPAGFTAALEILHKGKVPVDDLNRDFAEAYTIGALAFGFTQKSSQWTFSEFLRVDNLADEQYVGSVIVNDGNRRYFEPAPGRSWMLGFRAQLSF